MTAFDFPAIDFPTNPPAAQFIQEGAFANQPLPPPTQQQQWAFQTDQLIQEERRKIPEAVRLALLERRNVPRLTIQQLNQMSENAIRGGLDPQNEFDTRTPIVRVLDLVDLPRNTISNIAFGDPSAGGFFGSLAGTAGLFAGAGAIVGGGIPGAVLGAIAGTAVFLVGAGIAGITRAFGGDQILEQNLDSLERGTFGQPKVWASDILQRLGFENKVIRAVVGFAGDVLLDPLTYVGGASAFKVLGTKGIKVAFRKASRRVLADAVEEAALTPSGLLRAGHPLESLFQKSEKVGEFFHDATNEVNKVGELLSELTSVREQVAAGTLGAREAKKAIRNVTNQLTREIAFFGTTNLQGFTALEQLKAKASREFLREYAAKSALTITFPFAGTISNRFSRVLGGRSLEIPIGSLGPSGRLRKALGQTDNDFLEALTQKATADKIKLNSDFAKLTDGLNLVRKPDFVTDTFIGPALPDVIPLNSVDAVAREELIQAGYRLTEGTDLVRLDEIEISLREFDDISKSEQILNAESRITRLAAVAEKEEDFLKQITSLEQDPTHPSVFTQAVRKNLQAILGLESESILELQRLQTPQALAIFEAADNYLGATARGEMLTSMKGLSGGLYKLFNHRYSNRESLYSEIGRISNKASTTARSFTVGANEIMTRLRTIDPAGTGIGVLTSLTVKSQALHDGINALNDVAVAAQAGLKPQVPLMVAPDILTATPDIVPFQTILAEGKKAKTQLKFDDELDKFLFLTKEKEGADALTKARREEAYQYIQLNYGIKRSAVNDRRNKMIDEFVAQTKKLDKLPVTEEGLPTTFTIPASKFATDRRKFAIKTKSQKNILDKMIDDTINQIGQTDFHIAEARDLEADLLIAKNMIKASDDAALLAITNLRKQIETMEETMLWKTTRFFANIQLKGIRDTFNIGRKLTPENEAIRRIRTANENQAPLIVAELATASMNEVRALNKKLGGKLDSADLSLAVEIVRVRIEEAKYLNEAGETLLRGYTPQSTFSKRAKEITENPKYIRLDGSHMLLDSPEVKVLAVQREVQFDEFALLEIEAKVLTPNIDPLDLYMPVRFTERARIAGERLGIERGNFLRATASGKRISTKQTFSQRKVTRQIPYAGDLPDAPSSIRTTGRAGTNFVYGGELAYITPMDTKNIWERERQLYLDAFPAKMTAGDVFDRSLPAHPVTGEAPDQFARRWAPDGYAMHPIDMNESRHRIVRRLGSEITGDIFETDFQTVLAQRTLEHVRAISAANFAKMMKPHIKVLPVDQLGSFPKGLTSGTRLIDGVEMRAVKQNLDTHIRLPIEDAPDGMVQLWPEDVATGIEQLANAFKTDKDISVVLKALDGVMTVWKTSILFRPAWWSINMIGGAVLSHLAGIDWKDVPRLMMDSRKTVMQIHGLGKDQLIAPFKFIDVGDAKITLQDFRNEIIVRGIASNSRTLTELVSFMRMGSPEAKNLMGRMFADTSQLIPKYIGKWFQFNAATDDIWRVMTYLSLRRQGFDADSAMREVHKFLFDWGDFTQAEREWGSRILPFYRWIRSNVALQMKLILEKPHFHASFPKIHKALEEGFVDEEAIPPELRPRWIRDAMGAQVSADPKSASFLLISSLTPAQELFEIGQSVMGAEGFSSFMNYFVSSGNPIVKNAFEIAAGVNIFTGQGIGDPALGKTSIPEHLGRQSGTIGVVLRGIYNPKKTVEEIIDDPVKAVIRLFIGGRFQRRQVAGLVASKRFEEGETIGTIRTAVKRAMRDGDQDEADRLAAQAIVHYKILWELGYVDAIPKFLRGTFRKQRFIEQRDRNE